MLRPPEPLPTRRARASGAPSRRPGPPAALPSARTPATRNRQRSPRAVTITASGFSRISASISGSSAATADLALHHGVVAVVRLKHLRAAPRASASASPAGSASHGVARHGRKLNGEHVLAEARDAEAAPFRRRRTRTRKLRPKHAESDVRRRERGMPGKRQLARRREEADVEPIPAIDQESGGRDVLLRGDRREDRVVEPVLKAADDGGIAGEDAPGKQRRSDRRGASSRRHDRRIDTARLVDDDCCLAHPSPRHCSHPNRPRLCSEEERSVNLTEAFERYLSLRGPVSILPALARRTTPLGKLLSIERSTQNARRRKLAGKLSEVR